MTSTPRTTRLALLCTLYGVAGAFATPTFRVERCDSAAGRAWNVAPAAESDARAIGVRGAAADVAPVCPATQSAFASLCLPPRGLYDLAQLGGVSPVQPVRYGAASRGGELHALPPPPSSLTLGLTALAAVGALQAGRSVRKLHLGHAPEWYHEWARPVGRMSVVEIDAAGRVFGPPALAPDCAFAADGRAATQVPRLERAFPFLHDASADCCASELVLLLTAARPPPGLA